MGKRPSLQWYPGDWLRDPGVRSVSYAARGLWTDMLCLMFESDRKGYLQLAGCPVSPDQLARMTGGSAEQITLLLQELETSGVFSRTEHGMIYSRRMVRDESKRELCREAGKLGGNPTLKGRSKGRPKGGANPNPTPSSSTSSSSSTSVEEPPLPPELNTPDFRQAWKEWVQYRKERKPKITPTGAKRQLSMLSSWGVQEAIAAIHFSIAQGYQGLISPEDRKRRQPPQNGAATFGDKLDRAFGDL